MPPTNQGAGELYIAIRQALNNILQLASLADTGIGTEEFSPQEVVLDAVLDEIADLALAGQPNEEARRKLHERLDASIKLSYEAGEACESETWATSSDPISPEGTAPEEYDEEMDQDPRGQA